MVARTHDARERRPEKPVRSDSKASRAGRGTQIGSRAARQKEPNVHTAAGGDLIVCFGGPGKRDDNEVGGRGVWL